MKREHSALMAVMAITTAFSVLGGCSRQLAVPTGAASNPGASYTPIASNATVYTPPQACNLLGTNLYNFYQGQSGNVFFSPFSIITCLAMAQEGAVGNTQVQMQNVLNLNPNTQARLAGFQSLIGEINAPGKAYTLETADNMWLQQGFPFLASYINTVQTYYDAGVTNVNFQENPSGALQEINGAVSQETDGYIPQLFSSLPGNTELVLTNAIYFKGSWEYQFPVSQTALQAFNMTATTSEPVSMMHITFNANVENFGNGAASVLAIPYASGQASMYVFLPPLGGMANLEAQLGGNILNTWLTANSAAMTVAGVKPVILTLPKFSFKTDYDLTAPLSQIGMPLAFTTPGPTTFTGADFWNIDGTNNLYITDVVHQAFVDVSETGTTAAAATGVVGGCSDCGVVVAQPIPVYFTVDQPFLFMIVDNATNTVLFFGRVNDPLSTS